MRKIDVLCLLALLVLGGLKIAYAEITTPYTVDEKPRVSFGDMTAVSGYEGLENYTYGYVGGYLHITFTTTHHNCCFSSYPPKIYITAEDPRNTAIPTVRSSLVTLQLLAGTHPTNWYEYDIQFDSSGYTVIVRSAGVTVIENRHENIAGQNDTDYAALANDFDVSPSSLYSMSFAPQLIHEAPPSSESSVSQKSKHRGDYLRCVETNIGLYCPSMDVRYRYIKENLEQLLGVLQLLFAEISKDNSESTNSHNSNLYKYSF